LGTRESGERGLKILDIHKKGALGEGGVVHGQGGDGAQRYRKDEFGSRKGTGVKKISHDGVTRRKEQSQPEARSVGGLCKCRSMWIQ